MAKFSVSFPTTFQCCCSLNRKSVCLWHWMEVWRRKGSVKSSRIYFSIVRIWCHFRGLTKCYQSIVREWSLQAKPVKMKFRMKIVKQWRRAKKRSKYEYKDVFHSMLCKLLSVFLSFRCEATIVEGESSSFSAKLSAVISVRVNYLTQSVERLQIYAFFLCQLWIQSLPQGTSVFG